MSSIRNKHGSLQMYKGKKWKTYFFKVTGSTYLHYFGESKASEPKDQIFLTTISAVEIPPKAPKNGNFVFEVRHSNKSSPWILSTDSEEERRDWMETIKPNSTTMLHSSQIKDIHQRNKSIINRGATISPQLGGNGSVTMAASRSPTVYQRGSVPYPTFAQNTPTGLVHGRNYSEPAVQPYPHTVPPFMSLGGTGGVMVGGAMVGGDSHQLTQSLDPALVSPTTRMSSPSLSPPSPLALTPPEIQPRPPETQPRPQETEPYPLQRPMSMSDRPPMPEPRQLMMAIPPAEYLDPLQLNMPAGSKKIIEDSDGGTCPVDSNGDQSTPTGNQYLLIAPPSKTRPSHKEFCPLKDHPTNAPHSPPGVTPPTTPPTPDPVFEALKSQFNEKQIQALVDMLAKMNDRGGGGGEANIGYLVTKTANTLTDSMLVTDDDDPDHYNERPKWAKAINEQVMDNSESLLPDASTVNNISRGSLINMKKIGAGHFGDVFSADYTPEGFGPEDSIKVAVKTAKKGCTEGQKKDILREVSVMANMVHPNLVRLYGINQEDPEGLPWLVLEYLPHGDLKHYLQNSPTKKSTESLVKYMVDVAMGMHYIAERGLVHRDLAARNVLVGHGEMCKVADFGLLRELPEDDSIYVSSSNVPCPIRWMPPEAISRRSFSVASDVWSFGILQWEMMNPGKLPYANFGNYEVVSKISEGYRMPTPRGCPPVVSRIMKSCWHADPKKRPSFLLITTLLTTKFTTQQATNRQNGAMPTSNNNNNVYM